MHALYIHFFSVKSRCEIFNPKSHSVCIEFDRTHKCPVHWGVCYEFVYVSISVSFFLLLFSHTLSLTRSLSFLFLLIKFFFAEIFSKIVWSVWVSVWFSLFFTWNRTLFSSMIHFSFFKFSSTTNSTRFPTCKVDFYLLLSLIAGWLSVLMLQSFFSFLNSTAHTLARSTRQYSFVFVIQQNVWIYGYITCLHMCGSTFHNKIY